MEDAATAEISRAQIWQWIHQTRSLQDGAKSMSRSATASLTRNLPRRNKPGMQRGYAAYEKSAQLMRDLIRSPQFVEFLTVPAYQKILSEGN